MTANPEGIKKRIKEDWLHAFPQLTAFASNKLYKVIGPAVFGIELIKLPNANEYRPHFVAYPLWKKDAKTCLDAPSILFQIYNNKKMLFSIPYLKHDIYFQEAVESVKKQVPIPMEKDVVIELLFEMINDCFNDILVKSSSAEQAKLLEFKFYTTLYACRLEKVEDVLIQIQEASKNWNFRLFDIWYGNFDQWFNDLRESINHRGKFLKQIVDNKENKKIATLKSSELYCQ